MAGRWLSLFVLSLMACSLARAQSAAQLAQRTFPSVVMIVTSEAHGQPLALGSGFVVGDGVIATNMHVIEGAAAARAKVIGRAETYTVSGVLSTDSVADLALLKVDGLDAPSLQLGQSKQAEVGDQVFAVGNPEGLEGTFSEGIVSGIREIGSGRLLQITAPISPGSSGGPVIGAKGEVLGIAVATVKEGQNLNFAVPVSYLKALITQSTGGPATPLASVAPQSSERSIVAQMGSAGSVGVTGEKFLWKDSFWEYGDYSFTLTNHLDRAVEDIDGLVIFYGKDGSVLDTGEIEYDGTIPPRLGERLKGSVDPSVKKLTTPPGDQFGYSSALTPSTKVEFRILNFTIAQ
jgi:hypothetical protein